MRRRYDWKGTRLGAAFLVLGGARLWPEIFQSWAMSGLLNSGEAVLFGVSPQRVTFGVVQNLEEASWLPRIAWQENPAPLAAATRDAFPWELTLFLHQSVGLAEVKLHFVVNQDDTLTIYIEAPYEEVFGVHGVRCRQGNLHRFITTSTWFFLPELCSVGVIDEESRIDGLTHILACPEKVADWAFYGRAMTRILAVVLRRSPVQPSDCRAIASGGMFVRWSDWGSTSAAPPAWISAVDTGLQRLAQEFHSPARR